jgi:hypothetical protein
MNSTSSIVLVLGGVVLMILGIQATGFFVTDLSRFLTAKPTNEAVCMLLAGAAVIGLVGTLRRLKPG